MVPTFSLNGVQQVTKMSEKGNGEGKDILLSQMEGMKTNDDETDDILLEKYEVERTLQGKVRSHT
jgi:hypothetical protein